MKGEEYLLKYLTNEELKEAYDESINYEDGFQFDSKHGTVDVRCETEYILEKDDSKITAIGIYQIRNKDKFIKYEFWEKDNLDYNDIEEKLNEKIV